MVINWPKQSDKAEKSISKSESLDIKTKTTTCYSLGNLTFLDCVCFPFSRTQHNVLFRLLISSQSNKKTRIQEKKKQNPFVVVAQFTVAFCFKYVSLFSFWMTFSVSFTNTFLFKEKHKNRRHTQLLTNCQTVAQSGFIMTFRSNRCGWEDWTT